MFGNFSNSWSRAPKLVKNAQKLVTGVVVLLAVLSVYGI